MSTFKEPTFFVWANREYDVHGPHVRRVGRSVIRDVDSYAALFTDAKERKVRGEASTGYLHTPGVAERIRDYVPDARLMAILRNPIDRAYSAFLHARRQGLEPVSDFEEVLREEPHRVRGGWIGLTLYTTVGMYATQLARYLDVFPCEQIRVYLFDDLVRSPVRVAQDAFAFLGVDERFVPNLLRPANQGGAIRSARLQTVFRPFQESSMGQRSRLGRWARGSLRRLNEIPTEPLTPELRSRLALVFEADVARLSDMLGRDVTWWLQPEGGAMAPRGVETALGMHPCG
jgi:hypothetical protein